MTGDPKTIGEAAARFPIGTAVRFYPVRGDFDSEDAVVRSAPWELCGKIVVKITGRAGGVLVDHLRRQDREGVT